MSLLDENLHKLDMPSDGLKASGWAKVYKLDVTETLQTWAKFMAESGIFHQNDLVWNGPRRPCVIHPSSVDNPCDFFLYLDLVGEEGVKEMSGSTQLILDTGTAIHGMMQYYQESRAKQKGYQYEAEVGFNPDNNKNCKVLRMAGHADGVSMGWPTAVKIVWEYKTISRKGFERLTSPHKAHVKQVHLYMLAVGAPVAFIVYICKDNSEIKTFKVKFSENVWRPLLERIFYIRECAKFMKDPEKRIGPSCRRCKHLKVCEPDLSNVREFGRLHTRFS